MWVKYFIFPQMKDFEKYSILLCGFFFYLLSKSLISDFEKEMRSNQAHYAFLRSSFFVVKMLPP